MQSLAERHLGDFRVRMVYRTDRYGRRRRDQVEFLSQGFPAVRVTRSHEDYDAPAPGPARKTACAGDTLDHVDFDYLANVTRLDAITLAALANAPAPPDGIQVRARSTTTPRCRGGRRPATGYRAWWRDTTAPQWQRARDAGAATSIVLGGVSIDDWFFGVSALGADGWKARSRSPGSPAASAVRRRPCPIRRRSEVANDGQDTIGSLKASGSSLKSPIGTHRQNTFLSP